MITSNKSEKFKTLVQGGNKIDIPLSLACRSRTGEFQFQNSEEPQVENNTMAMDKKHVEKKNRAVQLFSEGKTEEAILVLNEAIQIAPKTTQKTWTSLRDRWSVAPANTAVANSAGEVDDGKGEEHLELDTSKSSSVQIDGEIVFEEGGNFTFKDEADFRNEFVALLVNLHRAKSMELRNRSNEDVGSRIPDIEIKGQYAAVRTSLGALMSLDNSEVFRMLQAISKFQFRLPKCKSYKFEYLPPGYLKTLVKIYVGVFNGTFWYSHQIYKFEYEKRKAARRAESIERIRERDLLTMAAAVASKRLRLTGPVVNEESKSEPDEATKAINVMALEILKQAKAMAKQLSAKHAS